MVSKLDPNDERVAQQLWQVWQASYAVEAKLLGATDFPPLKRTVNEFQEGTTDFYGIWENGRLAAAMEINAKPQVPHLNSLVVHPDFFRRGFGRQLVSFALALFLGSDMTVETGVDNGPAIALYLKLGFVETGQYLPDHGIRKIKLRFSAVNGK